MTRKLGVFTRYHRHEVTYTALGIADRAMRDGIPVEVIADGVCRKEVSPYWDNIVRTDDLWRAVKNCTHLLWMRPPSSDVPIHTFASAGITNWLYVVSDLMQPTQAPAYQLADCVLCPFLSVQQAVEETWRFSINTRQLPQISAIPSNVRYRLLRSSNPVLLLPLMDTRVMRCDVGVLTMLATLLAEHVEIRVIVMQGRNWSPKTRKYAKNLIAKHGDRVTLLKQPSLIQQMTAYYQADLTIWPSRYEGLARVGLDSLAAGTPVVAWDIPPQNEYLQHDFNSYLVACEINVEWNGQVFAIPDYSNYIVAVVALLRNPGSLERMAQNCGKTSRMREQSFERHWRSLWHYFS